MPRGQSPDAYVLVEGQDDQHVIGHLCKRHRLPEALQVIQPDGGGGINDLLEGLTAWIKAPNLRTLGIVVDADESLPSRWQSLRDRLRDRADLQDRVYRDVPVTPPVDGWISGDPRLPRVGLWLMPDNQLPGMLEDFAARLIPEADDLLPKVEAALQDIERSGVRRYRPAHRSKALIHTWLAWQEDPGLPMGTSVKAGRLHHDAPLALAFVDWLRRLFDLRTMPVV